MKSDVQRTHSVLRVAIMACAMVCLLTLAAIPFSSSSAHAATPSVSQYCVAVLDKLQPGEQTSHVVSQQCTASEQSLVVPMSSTLLMVWYQNTNYNSSGGSSWRLYGAYGGCDSSGYGFPDTNGHTVRSYRLFNGCTWAREYSSTNYGGTCAYWQGDNWWVDVSPLASIWIYSTKHTC